MKLFVDSCFSWYIPEFGFSEIMFKWVYNSIQAALMDEIVIGSSQWDCKIYHFSSSVNPGETMMLAMCLFLFVSGALKVENSAVTQKVSHACESHTGVWWVLYLYICV